MPDGGTDPSRSHIMAAVRGKNTTPELRVRKCLHAMGYRFRLHRRDLAGTPDIVLPRYRTCIFVNGCFWHRHPGCKRATSPKRNAEFWEAKFARNVARDEANGHALTAEGWNVVTIWECETVGCEGLTKLLRSVLPRRS
ncbi:T/G mismatch-specific endonuclease [Meinhardsimonia xiamenensis]|jgi:DNA mismatch endonuclease (patch repair protein)|uniref:Very short patch repair endonuclease n=2 Tax=Meinhardsimonia xiamenensis TaxID=990712 RepID=A0A1G9E1N7_9RHOB|nr:very short patch repair endonuclease [Meinhardsimonia xiamenensis]PRX33961.1 T/G mismatch-specific endonuclease [Meinhardsimonia xiamenensis]SDK70023.1 T/G mismatch-specific endonuclease [Meinhardsimonia xiamenensis]